MARFPTGRRGIAWIGWLTILATTLLLAVLFAQTESQHIRALILGLAGALSLAIPPVRAAYRIFPYRRITNDGPDGLRVLTEAAINQRVRAFTEFSWFDVICFSLGPLLLAAGFIVDLSHESHESPRKPAAIASTPAP